MEVPTPASDGACCHCSSGLSVQAESKGPQVYREHSEYKQLPSLSGASQVAQWQRICLPRQKVQETEIQILGWEDPLEKEMATLSHILAWKILWTEESGGLQSIAESDTTEQLNTSTSSFCPINVGSSECDPWPLP